MKSLNYYLSAALFIVLSLFLITDTNAQRTVEYRQLAEQNSRSQLSFHRIVLPGTSDSTITMASVFSLPYSSLPFKKANRSSADNAFFSTAELNMEVFRSDKSKLDKNEDISVKGLESAARAFWSDTVYVENYEESKSQHQFVNGYLKATLAPGIYSYILQMKRGEETDSQSSRTQTVRLNSYSEIETGNVIMGQKLSDDQQPTQLTLSSLGQNIEYGKDFYTLIYLPDYEANANYTLEIINLQVNKQDTSRVSTVFTKELTSSDIKTNIVPSLTPEGNTETQINLTSSADGYTYALLEIPNSKLPNAMYRLTVQKEDQEQTVAESTYRSVWIDIPNSLLSLDVAIDMLHYIVDEKAIEELSTGTQREREQKFRKFWDKKDPTPDTDYNELMAEYYQRIDYAYENFTTKKSLGFNSDRGEIYIKFGPPNDINRQFPTNGPTREVWTYDSRKFVFRATTGFGDFRLVSDETR